MFLLVMCDILFGMFYLECYLCVSLTAADMLGSTPPSHPDEMTSYAWIDTLIMNTWGYASVIIPGFLIIKYLKQSHYLEQHGMLSTLVLFGI